MPVYGEGRKGILIVGEFPSSDDDRAGYPFSDEVGEFLKDALKRFGIRLFKDCWVTNSIICKIDKIANLPESVEHCRPNLVKTVKELDPKFVLLLGRGAVQSMVGSFWKDDVGPLNRWVGWQIPSTKPNAWIAPTYHPTHILRQGKKSPVLELYFERHLAEFAALVSTGARPWDPVPDYSANIRRVYDDAEVERTLDAWEAQGGTCAFDYENTALKPEYFGAEILCASVCWEGGETIAYPWLGRAISATGRFLKSPRVAKIAANLKHENRWTLYTFGHQVENWVHDTMLATHFLDNRPGGICSLKFQAYVNFGAEAYDEHIHQFLQGRGEDGRINTARDEIDMDQLLLYCGTDSFLEYLLARRQRKQIKTKFST